MATETLDGRKPTRSRGDLNVTGLSREDLDVSSGPRSGAGGQRLSPSRRHHVRAAPIAAAVAVGPALVDWISKGIASAALDDGPVELIAGLSLRLGHNPGIAFGLGGRLPAAAVVTVTAALTAVLVFAFLGGVLPSTVGAGLILGGAVGNLGDRILGGSVVDFIDLTWWPSFNLADVFLTVGVVWSMVSSLRDDADAESTVPSPHDSGAIHGATADPRMR